MDDSDDGAEESSSSSQDAAPLQDAISDGGEPSSGSEMSESTNGKDS